jgi:hypothetical protein
MAQYWFDRIERVRDSELEKVKSQTNNLVMQAFLENK